MPANTHPHHRHSERKLAKPCSAIYRRMMTPTTNRRQFTKRTLGGLAAFPFIARMQAANSKLRIAAIGTGNRAKADIDGVAHEHLVAFADVDQQFLALAHQTYSGVKTYQDFRVMLEKEENRIDAVVVGTPDHTHAPAAAMALRMGKHVYCEKPLTHTVHESRTLMSLAKEKNLITQMGTQIHAGENYREVVELIRSQIIGPIKEVHVWMNTSLNYSDGHFATPTTAPSSLDWDLWLGPAPKRPYSDGIHPFNWRKFWDYGTGRLGDFGCHYLDLVHWALDLKQPVRVQANGPQLSSVSPPSWLKVDYHYAAGKDRPPLKVTWYGGLKPPHLTQLQTADGHPIDWGSGQLFVGSDGMVLSNYSNHFLLKNGRALNSFDRPPASIPRSIGHHREWTEAIRNNGSTTCNFDYAGNLSQTVLLGSVAYKLGKPLEWEATRGIITNLADGQTHLHKEYRSGWSL